EVHECFPFRGPLVGIHDSPRRARRARGSAGSLLTCPFLTPDGNRCQWLTSEPWGRKGHPIRQPGKLRATIYNAVTSFRHESTALFSDLPRILSAPCPVRVARAASQ